MLLQQPVGHGRPGKVFHHDVVLAIVHAIVFHSNDIRMMPEQLEHIELALESSTHRLRDRTLEQALDRDQVPGPADTRGLPDLSVATTADALF